MTTVNGYQIELVPGPGLDIGTELIYNFVVRVPRATRIPARWRSRDMSASLFAPTPIASGCPTVHGFGRRCARSSYRSMSGTTVVFRQIPGFEYLSSRKI